MPSDSTKSTTRRIDSLPSIGEVLEGRYEISRVIGEGGMGVVVEARDRRLDRLVAVKLMHRHLAQNEDFVRRFEREVLIAKKINHAHTVRVYDYGVTQAGQMYLVMEHLDGRELREVIGDGLMSPSRVHRLGQQLLDGLAEAHAQDVVHRDLKPGNVFVCEDRRGREVVKVLDFGIAKSLGDAQQAITNTGQVVGTAPYLAPELFLVDGTSKTADVYATGLILLEMLLGRKVVDAPSLGQTMSRHIHMPIILPETLRGTQFGWVLLKAVAKAESARFADAEEMLEALHAAVVEEETPLAEAEVEAAIAKMEQAYQRNAQMQSGPTQTLQSFRQGTMVLQEGDVEVVSGELLGYREPTAVTMRVTPRPGEEVLGTGLIGQVGSVEQGRRGWQTWQIAAMGLLLVALSVGLTAVTMGRSGAPVETQEEMLAEVVAENEVVSEELREEAFLEVEETDEEVSAEVEEEEEEPVEEVQEESPPLVVSQPRVQTRREPVRQVVRPAPVQENVQVEDEGSERTPDVFDSILDQVLSD